MYDPGALYVVDPILSGFSDRFAEQTLYGERIMPLTPVNAKSARYMVFNRADWQVHDDRREPGTVANEIQGKRWSLDSFNLREHSLQSPIFDEERQQLASIGSLNANSGDLSLNPERDATLLVTRSIMLKHEQKVSVAIRNTANYAGGNTVTLAGAQQWSDYTGGTSSTSDPVGAIRTAIRVIKAATGRTPNRMAVPDGVLEYIENHPRVIDRFKNFSLTNAEAWRTLTGFEGEIFIVDSVYNAANHVDATESITSFWGKDVWIGIVDEAPGQMTRTFGKTFAMPYPSGNIRPTDRWREEPRKADIVRTSMNYDIKITSNVAGYLIKNAIA
jgi:hypothetical protein